LIERLVRFLIPPRENRIVTVIERVPVSQVGSQPVDRRDGSIRDCFLYSRWFSTYRTAPIVYLFSQVSQSRSDLCGINWLHPAPALFQIDDFRGEGNQRLDLAELACLNVELAQLVFEVVLEKYVIDLPVLAHRVEV
jgi:hypothetical protein